MRSCYQQSCVCISLTSAISCVHALCKNNCRAPNTHWKLLPLDLLCCENAKINYSCCILCACVIYLLFSGLIVKSRVISKLSANAVSSYLVEAISTDVSPLSITVDLHNTTVDSRHFKQTENRSMWWFHLVVPNFSIFFKNSKIIIKERQNTYNIFPSLQCFSHSGLCTVCSLYVSVLLTTPNCNISVIIAVTAVNNCRVVTL